MHIRRLTPPDAVAYRALMLRALDTDPEAFIATRDERAPLPLSWWENRLSEDPAALEGVLGAFDGERLVGFAGLRRQDRLRTRHKATLFGLFVDPDFRGRGLGRSLVRAVLDHARTIPYVQLVQLTVFDTNTAACTVYEACGFRTFGLEPFANHVAGRYVAMAHLWCPLDPGLTDA